MFYWVHTVSFFKVISKLARRHVTAESGGNSTNKNVGSTEMAERGRILGPILGDLYHFGAILGSIILPSNSGRLVVKHGPSIEIYANDVPKVSNINRDCGKAMHFFAYATPTSLKSPVKIDASTYEVVQ